MTEEEKRAHAIRIAQEMLSEIDFDWIYNDMELGKALPLSEKDSENVIEDIVEIICTELEVVFRD